MAARASPLLGDLDLGGFLCGLLDERFFVKALPGPYLLDVEASELYGDFERERLR